MRFRARLFGCCLIAMGLSWPAAAQAIVADLPLGNGNNERVLLIAAPQPRATVVLLPGGDGLIEIGAGGDVDRGGNFLVRTRNAWAQHGISALIVGPMNGNSLLGIRHTPGYAAALAAAIDLARSRANAPVWLIGTSQGSTAAANGAAHLPGRVAGVVLTSSVTQPNRSGETVFDADPGAITVPALVVSNQNDTCVASPPGDGNRILAALARAPRREFVLVASNQSRGDPCEAFSPHGFLGIEDQVVQRIAEWIIAAAGR
ncbi:MAG: alpha/beta hydrolase [Alphaproteobacteria bacterium]|nr:alpha/beta hydrolase [Alphaproteobacteria bacterium]